MEKRVELGADGVEEQREVGVVEMSDGRQSEESRGSIDNHLDAGGAGRLERSLPLFFFFSLFFSFSSFLFPL